ncbi:MAG: KH domain-containing protein [Candidatus Saganbacteria bacterium]|nr:KH domain-containing protein [Candidatus Saganbacteria bacterium]
MKELVEYIVKSLADKPEAVEISETQRELATVIEVRTAPEDAGKIIGREGRIANAIRAIVRAASAKQQKRISVEIMTEKEK